MASSDWASTLQPQGSWSCFNFVGPIFSAPSKPKEEFPGLDEDPVDVFILAGQSNMAGRGGVVPTQDGLAWDGHLPSMCSPIPGKVLRFTANSAWENATEPGHHDIDNSKICGVGPGLPFATSLIEMGYSRPIGLVPCAIGGTDIDLWQDGSKLFSNTIRRASAAISARPGSRFAGLLWYQGESDADTEEHSLSYQSKLERLMSSLRTALGDAKLPIIQVAISSTRAEVPYVKVIREAQFKARVPYMITVDAQGLDLQDGFHLSTVAQCKLAREMAAAYMAKFCQNAESVGMMDAPHLDENMDAEHK